MDIFKVNLSDEVVKLLKKNKVPKEIENKLKNWVSMVSLLGILKVRKFKGFHDEPLQGKKFGRRSIRLNRSWRAEYIVKNEEISFLLIEEVHNHDY